MEFLRLLLVLFIISSIVLSCTDLDEELSYTESEEYHLLMTSNAKEEHLRKSVLRFFTLVAFGSEYGHDFQITTKWKKRMHIYVGGNRDSSLIAETHRIINELNELFLDGFHIAITEDSLNSNFFIFLGSPKDYSQLFPGVASYVEHNDGLVMTEWNENFEIEKGHMYVNNLLNDMDLKRHILREELTQALGLAKDIPYYSNSIFFSGRSRVTEYSGYDIETIRLLYHPKMQSGLSIEIAEQVLADILGVDSGW